MYDYEEPVKDDRPGFRLPGWIACAPFEEYLGMRIEEAKGGRAVLTMPFRVKLAQGKGLMHGGAVTSIADTAVAIAIKSMVPEGTDFVTVEMSLKFLTPVKEGTVRAEARATPLGERKIGGEADIYNGATKVAEFRALFVVKRNA